MQDSPSIPRSAARIIRAAATTWWLTVQTASDIGSGAHDEWRQRPTRAAVGALLRRLVMLCRHHLARAVGRRASLQFGGWGTHPGNVDRGAEHRQHGLLVDKRRRHVMMLLRSLGANADEVEANPYSTLAAHRTGRLDHSPHPRLPGHPAAVARPGPRQRDRHPAVGQLHRRRLAAHPGPGTSIPVPRRSGRATTQRRVPPPPPRRTTLPGPSDR